jgi:hypothetical protein
VKIEEEFLHFIWQNRLFSNQNLFADNQKVEILQTGFLNTYSGPDFSLSKIKIGNTLWAGNVEIHVKTSDWFKHNHQKDEAYKNVILHVVYENDIESEDLPPCLELKGHISDDIIKNYQSIKNEKGWLPCAKLFHLSDTTKNNIWFERLLIERIERKTEEISAQFIKNNNDLEQTMFVFIAKSIGLKANSFPFEMLSFQTPVKTLLKYANEPSIIEAILLGQAGFLTNPKDEYSIHLKKQHEFYKLKHNLEPISNKVWKTGGVRPFNQPALKIAQLAQLVTNLFPFSQKVLHQNFTELKKLFKIKTSEYWNDHYTLGKVSPKKKKDLGESTINSIIINTLVPYYFFIAKHRDKQELKEKALGFLEIIPPEKNSIISNWKDYNLEIKSAWNSQSLLEQKNNYCNKLLCLKCGIGNQIIKSATK